MNLDFQVPTTYNDQEYYNLSDKPGWFVDSIITNKEDGYVNEFLDKEGKWFNHINKNVNTKIKADTCDFTFQGIGFTSASSGGGRGCTDPLATNYDPTAAIDDGNCCCAVVGDGCYYPLCGAVYGCTDEDADNWNPSADTDDGSCTYPAGCLECSQNGADPSVPGCCDDTMVNYDPLATCNDLSCIAFIYGCTDPLALNYYGGADIDNGSCVYVAGCTDATASNYNSLADYDDGSCTYGPVISGPCTGVTAIPDSNFEARLISYTPPIDSGSINGFVNNANICSITHLNTSYNTISNHAGIEGFTLLSEFSCQNNELTSIDVSQNLALTLFNCVYNQITSLDVSNNLALTHLGCYYNNLTSLDVSQNTALTQLMCSDNQLQGDLDVSSNTSLVWLDCHSNQLTSLTLGAGIDLNNLTLKSKFQGGSLVIHVGATAGRIALAQSLFTVGNNSISPGTTFAI